MKNLLFLLITLYFTNCGHEIIDYKIINQDLLNAIQKFSIDVKESTFFRGKYISLSIVLIDEEEYLVALTNGEPNCENYYGTIEVNNFKVSLFTDSVSIDNNPLIQIYDKGICKYSENNEYTIDFFQRDFIFQKDVLRIVNTKSD